MIEGTQMEGALLNSGMTYGLDATEMILGSVMVQEFDQQLNSFNAELVAMNRNKAEYREHRDLLTENSSHGEPYRMAFEGELQQEGMLYGYQQFDMIRKVVETYGGSLAEVHVEGDQRFFVSAEKIDALKEKIDAKIQDLNSMSEIKMIQFQSLMDSRKQAMMMLSNLMNSNNQTKMAIIQNMKG